MRQMTAAAVAALLAVQAVPPPATLAGADEAAVSARLGEPLAARREGLGAMWTYRLPGCLLYVYFRHDGAALRVSALEAAPLTPDAPRPAAEACLAEAERSAGR